MHWKKEWSVLGLGMLLIFLFVGRFGTGLWQLFWNYKNMELYRAAVSFAAPVMDDAQGLEYGVIRLFVPARRSRMEEAVSVSEHVPVHDVGRDAAEEAWSSEWTTEPELSDREQEELADRMREENQQILLTYAQQEMNRVNREMVQPQTDDQGSAETEIQQGATGDAVQGAAEEGTGQEILQQELLEDGRKTVINRTKLEDFDYLIQHFYIVDRSTTATSETLNAKRLLSKDLRLNLAQEGPQILIYHTHSQECYADSVPGDPAQSVMAVGDYLEQLLTEQYGLRVLHHRGTYDVEDRDHAYSRAAKGLQQVLAENPSIQVVIDLHRDSVGENTHLVKNVDGRPTANVMFFNGMCYTTSAGKLTNMLNPYLEDNLAFSLQMQIMAAEYYPEWTRRIYLKGYRYNMNYCPKSLLVEVGAQNNTLEEAMNAMLPLADVLNRVLTTEPIPQ